MLQEAASIRQAAQQQVAENQARAQELQKSLAAADAARAAFEAKLETFNAICRG